MSARQLRQRPSGKRTGGPAVLIGGAVALLALPSTVLAFATEFDMPADVLPGNGSFGAAPVDGPLARAIAARPAQGAGEGSVFRFTPAGTATRPDRSITVAVRVDPATAQAITVRGILPAPVATGVPGASVPAPAIAAVRIAPTAFNLGVSGGAPKLPSGTLLPTDIRKIDMPDLAAFKPSNPARSVDGRGFAPRIALDEREKTGRAPRTFGGDGQQTVDLGGSYRISRNLDVTAGVRYEEERDRLAPLPDGKQSNQAVYLGTQFRF